MRRITVRVACAQLAARPLQDAHMAIGDILKAIRRATMLGAQLVVFPECAYPGYVLLDKHPYRAGIPKPAYVLKRVSAAARHAGIDVALGIALETNDGALQNAALYIDREGKTLAHYAKRYLWNFDRGWFKAGSSCAAFETRFGRLGMMICADARVPEIPQALAAQGAWLILDPTAWVGYGTSYDSLRNPQVEFMLAVRAYENGVAIAAADKCGSEHHAIHYAGRSQIVAADGSVLAVANAAGPEVVVAELVAPQHNRFIRGRGLATSMKPAHDSLIKSDGRAQLKRKSTSRGSSLAWLGIYQGKRSAAKPDHFALGTLKAQGADAIIYCSMSVQQARTALAKLPGVRSALFTGRAMLRPDGARLAARAGEDLIVWLDPPRQAPILAIARTRALESRIFVALCCQARPDVSACLISPDGFILAAALLDKPSAFMAPIDVAAARRKLVVPGTQTFDFGVASAGSTGLERKR